MGRRPGVDGGRPHPITVRLSDREAQALDQARRGQSRSEFIRVCILRALGKA